MLQFHVEHRSLKSIHPIVVPDVFMKIAAGLAVAAERARKLRNLVVIGGERATLAICAQVLARIKTECCGMAEAAHSLAAVGGAMGLTRVLNHRQAMTGGDVDDGSQISRPAIEVYGNDGAGSRSDDLL